MLKQNKHHTWKEVPTCQQVNNYSEMNSPVALIKVLLNWVTSLLLSICFYSLDGLKCTITYLSQAVLHNCLPITTKWQQKSLESHADFEHSLIRLENVHRKKQYIQIQLSSWNQNINQRGIFLATIKLQMMGYFCLILFQRNSMLDPFNLISASMIETDFCFSV